MKRKYDVSLASGSCSSSAVPTLRWKYDVFLSFRGEDTRYNFVDHLYTALDQRGIWVFKDDEELKRGKAISPELLKAIEESKFAVVVFSKNYANSSWCLDELAKIIKWHNEMGQKVIPVFYHVDPSDIRGQKNKVAVFFQQHEDTFREELDKVKEWRESLTAAAKLAGHHISKTTGESSYISKIVEEVLADRQLSYMESNLVGIESRMDALNSLLKTEENDEVRIVGIHGMGGIGKTTMAKALFQRIANNFEGSSFVKDVRENSSSDRDLCALQEKVLREILRINHNFNVQDPEEGANKIRKSFERKKVLIVLDDVDNSKQLEFLAATHNWFGLGSRIIITTRNAQLLSDANAKYEPDGLPKDEALELFSRHAFKTNSPPKGYKELSDRVIRCAGYLPLAVKVLGSFFHGKIASVWESALDRLAKAQNIEVFKALKLSFDGLEDSEKEIFLDIACFFKGERVQDVTKVLECCGFNPQIGIYILIERSLITISGYERIGMHDLIQEMGRQIVRESFPNSRLWQLEDIHDSLKNERELKKIEAIVVSNEPYDIKESKTKVGFSANVFKHMKNLRLLDIRGRFTSSEPAFFPDNLQWLSWSWYPFSSLPMTDMSKLVGLEVVRGTIKQFWNGQKIMPNLKIVKLQELHHLTVFPDVSGAPNIEKLKVCDCHKLVEFHKTLGSHKRISKLKVIGCGLLMSLPSRFEMESLKTLMVVRCSSLGRFPDVSPRMVKLSSIILDCSNIEGLLSSLGNLSSLDYLDLERCIRPRDFDLGIERDIRLLLWKPISLNTPIELRSLNLLNLCSRPMECEFFLKNLQSFSSLTELNLSNNRSLKQLPATISHLSFLRNLKLNHCRGLKILHGLPSSIERLEANDCYDLEKIDDLSEGYDCLHSIRFANCRELLKDEDSKRYLEKMSRESFIKRCAVVDRETEISIGIPGNKIPSWLKEEELKGFGYKIRLMIPPKCNNQIKGAVIYAFFPPEEWKWVYCPPRFDCYFEFEDGVSSPQKEFDCADLSFEQKEFDCVGGNTLILYKPYSSIWGFQREESYGGGVLNLVVRIKYTKMLKKSYKKFQVSVFDGPVDVRCAAHLIYEED